MTEIIHRVESLSDGDLVRVTKGEFTATGRVGGSRSARRHIVGVSNSLTSLQRTGHTIVRLEKAKVPLPSVPGFYVDQDGDQWLYVSPQESFVLTEDHGSLPLAHPVAHRGLQERFAPYRLTAPIKTTPHIF